MSQLQVKQYFILMMPLAFSLLFAFASAWHEVPLWTVKDPCPSAIRAIVPSNRPFGRWRPVHDAMRTCSSITELELRMVGPSCTEHPDGWNLPFRTDGSDRYLSAPQVLSFSNYEFHESEWENIRAGTPQWANKDGSWPVSNSTSSIAQWATNMFYRSRWHIDQMTYRYKYAIGQADYSTWWGHGKAQRWYNQRNIPVERLSKDNMQLWLEAMDFSKVRTLSIEDTGTHPEGKGLLIHLPPTLTGLETLSIQGRWLNWRTYLAEWEAAPGPLPKNKWSSSPPPPARDFILALPPSLKNLTWMESGTVQEDVFGSVIKHHGPSLQHLKWTNRERAFKPRPILTDNQLESLGKWAPGLTSLNIDLHLDNWTLPQEKLEILSKALPNLRNLVINLNLLDGGLPMSGASVAERENQKLKSAVDEDEAFALFQGLRKSKDGEKLDSIEFRQGDWTDEWPFVEEIWEDRFWVKCWVAEEDGRPVSSCKSGHENVFESDWT
ncbi:hypothetical protein DER45DRAFT_580260 [Fusarium avenaceum]|nr:hypothetical protein DER45DRAFT_580260 [Fusarium avenaceum]